jgi:hypothetical protein
MGHHQRNFHPKQFQVQAARSWDNFFWWIEVQQYPQRTIVEPANWPPKRGFQASQIKGEVRPNTSLSITTGVDKLTIWLSPDVVNFDQPIKVLVNGRPLSGAGAIEPNLEILLEDARTRADRLHPFWAKVDR